eukprot:4251348-Amphidinium_carterae.1
MELMEDHVPRDMFVRFLEKLLRKVQKAEDSRDQWGKEQYELLPLDVLTAVKEHDEFCPVLKDSARRQNPPKK